MHVCRLFDAPWRFTVKTVDTSLRALTDRCRHRRSHPAHRCFRARRTVALSSRIKHYGKLAQVEAEIDRVEAQTIERLATPPDNQVQQVELLGKLLLYDKYLSVNRNEACAFCHMPETGFTGPVSELNRTTGSYPGSVRTRFSERKPQTHAYAPLSPVLHYNPGSG